MTGTEVHEFGVAKFKDGVSKEEQAETMRRIGEFVAPLAGFKHREYFYSEADGRWVDHLVWASLDDAKASEKVSEDPEAAALFGKFDPATVVFSRYQRVGGTPR